jgi:predicted unusual protein kinase regulating ubiquinone biosynthesis (AarF/ABC1/UbiB family)
LVITGEPRTAGGRVRPILVSASAIEGLVDAALGLARSTTSGRVALAASAALVPPALQPPALRGALADAAAQAAEPVPFAAVQRALRAAWDAPPADELDDLESAPAAVTPTGQVHRGVLDGAPVAVKVQRPGLAQVVRADLALLDTLAAPLRLAFPRLDAGAALAEVRERALDELDLEHEASVQRRLARGLRDDPELLVPAPVLRLAHPTVLVGAWVDGEPVGALAGAPEAERAAAARALVRFHVGSARRGLVHADPAPGHALRLADGRFAFLDAGSSRDVDPARVDGAVDALDALADEDGAALGAALAALGWLPAAEGQRALDLAWHAAGPLLAGEAVLDVAALEAVRERALERLDEGLALAAVGTPVAEDLLPLRMLGALALVVAPLAPELDWLGEVRAAATGGGSGSG